MRYAEHSIAAALGLAATVGGAAPILAIRDTAQAHTTVAGRPAYPLPDIICFGDSLTDGGYVEALRTLVGPRRTVLKCGIGGETSPEILARIVGAVQIYPVGNETWTRGQTVTLRANLPEPFRLTQTNHVANWKRYFETIDRVTRLQFVAGDRVLAETDAQQAVAVATAYALDPKRLNAPAHGLANGTRLRFGPPEAVPPSLSPWRFYYVVQADGDGFAVAESASGEARDLGGEAAAGLTAQGDFVAHVVYDGSYSPAEVSIRTRTEHERWTTVTWMGNNNYTQTDRIQSDVVQATRQQTPCHRRTLHLGIVNGDWPERWNTGANYACFTNYNAWLTSTWPDASLDIRSFLISRYDPTAEQDVLDLERDVIPRSLRVDGIHLNAKGNQLVATQVKQWLDRQPANTIEVWNAGDGALEFSSSSDVPWLRLIDGSGTLTGERHAIWLDLQGESLPVGLHTGHVTVLADGVAGSPKTVTVELTVLPDDDGNRTRAPGN
jgi:hypothetical protein